MSFTANLTPDRETGLGKWTVRNFIETIRTGRHLGRGREILPPMPIPMYKNFTDADLTAIFIVPAVDTGREEPRAGAAPAGGCRSRALVVSPRGHGDSLHCRRDGRRQGSDMKQDSGWPSLVGRRCHLKRRPPRARRRRAGAAAAFADHAAARIGPMRYTGAPHKYDDPRLGVSYQYGGDGLSLTVYVYDSGETNLVDGADTMPTCREFEIAKAGRAADVSKAAAQGRAAGASESARRSAADARSAVRIRARRKAHDLLHLDHDRGASTS